MRNYLKRALHFDFHTLPAIPDLGADFDAEKFASQLSEAKVEYINFFARCNLGHSYYPTKVGIRHPYLKDKDIYGDLLRACHKRDIGVLYLKMLSYRIRQKSLQIQREQSKSQLLFLQTIIKTATSTSLCGMAEKVLNY